MKEKIFGYVLFIFLMSYLLYRSVCYLVEIWWIVAIIIALVLAVVIIYRIVKNRRWH